jgi:hypothetical protein
MAAISAQESYLSAAIGSTDTNISVLNGMSYPDTGSILLIGSEQILYGDHDGNTFTECTRGYNGTTAASHSIYDAVSLIPYNKMLFHENGVDDYATSTPLAMNSYIQSSDFDIGDGNNFGFVNKMLPDVTFDGSNVAAPQVTITLRPRQNSGANYGNQINDTVASGNNYNPAVAEDPNLARTYTVQLFTGTVFTRVRGRQMAFKISSDTTGVQWQLGAPRIDIRQDGRR